MASLKTKEACLKCHAEQGYQEGEIRGGIRVTFPFRNSFPLAAVLVGHTGIGLAGLIGIFFAGRRLNNAYVTIRKQATLDEVTGVPNRRSFSERIEAELNRSWRDQEPLSLTICDIDHFKSYNDHYGHEEGDQCLKKVAQQIRNTLKRPSDFCARFGGEEFAVILPGTSFEDAMHVGEEIRKNI
ncbi:MAG: diguanylate cyclase [Desulfohalobiaceae bacterium]|nr:diguanylate cyclase [Desulfohalobiaceae bacterium]